MIICLSSLYMFDVIYVLQNGRKRVFMSFFYQLQECVSYQKLFSNLSVRDKSRENRAY